MTFEEYCDSQCYESHGYDFRHAEVGWAARSTIADAREAELRAEIERLRSELADKTVAMQKVADWATRMQIASDGK